jgi:hypothetical protein
MELEVEMSNLEDNSDQKKELELSGNEKIFKIRDLTIDL